MGSGDKVQVIGVTGVMASGKSLLCRFLRDEYLFHWIETDKIVHELYQVGHLGYQKIKEYFGPQFVGPKEVYRGRLRQFIMKSSQKLWILNQLVHQLVVHEVNKKIAQIKRAEKGKIQHSICIEAVYFEPRDLGKFIVQLIKVDAPDEVILERLKERKIPKTQIKKMLLFQRKNMPKTAQVIKNDGTELEFHEKVKKLLFLF
ncbi:MAG: dephospho-CoA kinase [Patescibacteria group bacterium]